MKKSIKVILSGLTLSLASLVGGILSHANFCYALILIGLSVALIGTFVYFIVILKTNQLKINGLLGSCFQPLLSWCLC